MVDRSQSLNDDSGTFSPSSIMLQRCDSTMWGQQRASHYLIVVLSCAVMASLSAESEGKCCELRTNWCSAGTESDLFLPRRAETVPQEVRSHRDTCTERVQILINILYEILNVRIIFTFYMYYRYLTGEVIRGNLSETHKWQMKIQHYTCTSVSVVKEVF